MRFSVYFLVLLLVAKSYGNEDKYDGPEDTEMLMKSNSRFTAKILNEVYSKNADKSFVVSAFSVLSPLAQLSLTTVGDSHDQLLRVMYLPNENAIHAVYPLIEESLRSTKGVELKSASAVYISQDAEVLDGFQDASRDIFKAGIKKTDFSKNVEAAKEINDWIEEQTNHQIKNLVDASEISGDIAAMLVNALYFKGSWKDKFNVLATNERDFNTSKSNTIKVPMMYQKKEFCYGESKELKAKMLELYYEGNECSFLMILPDDVEGLSDVMNKIRNVTILNKELDNIYLTETEVYIPKFKIETTTNLKQVLKQIGVTHIFDPITARIEKLLKTTASLFVSSATQKAIIEVNEEGAEAAAANVFQIVPASAFIGMNPTPVFDASHPFVFLLRKQGITLFSGVYAG